PVGLPEGRTPSRGGGCLGDFLLFLLLFLVLLVCLLRGWRSRGRRGGHRDGGLEGLVDVHAFQRGGQRLHAGFVDLHAGGGEDLLQVLLVHRLAGRVQDQRAVHIFHSCHLLFRGSPSPAVLGTRAARASI